MKKAFTKIASLTFLACLALWTTDALAGCNDPLACNYVSTDVDTVDCLYLDACGVCGGAGTVAGCMDTTACNYNSAADCDDGSCAVDDACGVCGGAGTVAGCTSTTACNYNASADCDDGSCEEPDGCTSTTACNYDSLALCDDGSCCELNCVTMDMTDSFGDGWNGCQYTITDAATSLVVASGNLDTAQSGDGSTIGSDALCLADGCYSMNVSGGGFESEVGWTLSGVDGGPLSGGAPVDVYFSINTANCFGCIDPGACNVDPLATYDDGSCDYSCIGCTVSAACNYEADNTIDDGSCCFDNCVVVNSAGGNFDSEHTWEMFDPAGVSVASGGVPVNQVLCLADGCGYSVVLTDSFGDGWNGTNITFTNFLGTVTYVNASPSGGLQTINGIGLGGVCGCIDSTACNYNCDADVDDGTCCYDNCITISVGGGTFDSEISWSFEDLGGTVIASGFAPETVEACITDGCYVMNMFDSFGDGWNGASYSVEATDGSVIWATGTLTAGQSEGSDEIGIPDACGCTDSLACNFDPLAVNDNGTCGYYEYTLTVGGGSFDGEIGWNIVDQGTGVTIASGGAPAVVALCLNQACYDLNMTDSFGDGWNGATYDLVDDASGLTLISGDLDNAASGDGSSVGQDQFAIDGGNGCIVAGCTDSIACNYCPACNIDDLSCEYQSCAGCTDSLACNYDSTATLEDGSCDYSCIGCSDSTACNYGGVIITVDDGSCCLTNCVTLDMTDSFGDGWNGAVYNVYDAGGFIVATGDLNTAQSGDGASVGSDLLCLADGCYDLEITGGSFASEIGWTLSGVDDGPLSGGAPSFTGFGLGGAVCALGCTTSSACNYDPAAVTDDGSCCFDECATLTIGGGSFPSEVSWTFYDTDGVTPLASGGSPFTGFFCIPSSCDYSIELNDSFGDGWNGDTYTFTDGTGAVIASGTLSSGYGPQVDAIAIGVSFGCTDSLANNYDPAADCDDGSCVTCPVGEQLITMTMVDSFGDTWNGNFYNITDAADGSGAVVATGDIATADSGDGTSFGVDQFCLPAGCYSIEVDGGSFQSEVSWTLTDQAGSTIHSGGAPSGILGFTLGGATGCGIVGCMDSACFNYNPYAETDDGSCICPPANDQSCNAIAVLCGDQVDGTTTNSTDFEALVGTNCGQETVTGPGVWYQFDGNGDQVSASTCNTVSGFDTKIFVYEAIGGDCTNLSCVASNDDSGNCPVGSFLSEALWTSTLAVDYYIYVSGFGAGTGDFTLNIDCVTCTGAPANDDCSGSITQVSGIAFPGDLCCANPEQADPCAPAFQSIYGVWFTFNSIDYDTFYFELNNGTGAAVGMTVWEDNGGGCGDLTALACCPQVTGTCAGDISQITDLEPNTDYYFTVWTTDAINCGTFDFLTQGEYLGCTDDEACNYDSIATVEDGSCEYFSCAQVPVNDECANATALPCGTLNLLGSNGGATANGPLFVLGCDAVPGPGVWYTYTGDGQLHTISTCGSQVDTKLSIYTSSDGTCTGTFACAEDQFFAPGTQLSEEDDNDVVDGCGFFDQDDVFLQYVDIPGETYFIYVSTQDPPQGGEFEISHTCEPVILGCQEAAACNYNPLANIDDPADPCDFTSCLCSDAGCAAAGQAYHMEMFDSFGDGWNGATYEVATGLGVVVESGSIDTADVTVDQNNFAGPEEGDDYFCICADDCYTITVGGGSWDSEISWNLYQVDGAGVETLIASGGAPDSAMWTQEQTPGTIFCGCTDTGACNFDSTATNEDGSCEYLTCAGCTNSTACNYDSTATIEDGSCCLESCLTVTLTDSFGDGWDNGTYEIFSWDTGLQVASGTLATGTGPQDDFYCLPEGCYWINVGGSIFNGELGWSLTGANEGAVSGGAPVSDVFFSIGAGGTCVSCQEPLACNYDSSTPVDDCTLCDFVTCQGCTYSGSPEYSSTATIDDGSCTFNDPCPTDLNDDLVTNTQDLLIFLAAFGQPC